MEIAEAMAIRRTRRLRLRGRLRRIFDQPGAPHLLARPGGGRLVRACLVRACLVSACLVRACLVRARLGRAWLVRARLVSRA